MSPSYLPVTIDGHDIPADAPRSQAMGDTYADAVTTKAEEYRSTVLHCHYDIADRTITLYAANAPEGPVLFNFGDGTGEIEEQITGEGGSASAEHTYARDGVYRVGVRTPNDRWFTEAAVNWPAPPTPPPPPEEIP
jgi:hypothetical protein